MEIVEHPNCPSCKEGIGEMHVLHKYAIDEAAKTGTIFIPAAQVNVYISMNPAKPPIVGGRLPALRAFKEVCEICGAEWVFRAERGHVTYTGNPRMPMKDFK
jgi:hypothetical protein